MKVEELVKRLRGIDHMSVEDCFLQSHLFGHAADKLEELAAENERLLNLCDRLRQEAKMHSMEARGANATIAKIYQAVTGRSGEPGNWNGAEPVIAALAEKDKEIAALRAERDFLQEILDARPAINAALPESYIRWSQSIYSGEAVRASLSARNEGGKDDND